MTKETFDRFMRIKQSSIAPSIPSFFCKAIKPLSFVPQSRENAVMIAIPDSADLYIFGGIGQEPITRLTKFEIYPNEQMEAHIISPLLTRESKARETDNFGQLVGRCGFAGCMF